jgi:hypothetical protein
MPWELNLRRSDGSALGSKADVVDAISRSTSGMTWEEEESTLYQAIKDPSHPLADVVASWSAEQRQRFAIPKLVGTFEAEEFSIELYGFETNPLYSIEVEARGNGNPMPILASICIANQWVVVENSTGQIIDLSDASRWTQFQQFRDGVIGGF